MKRTNAATYFAEDGLHVELTDYPIAEMLGFVGLEALTARKPCEEHYAWMQGLADFPGLPFGMIGYGIHGTGSRKGWQPAEWNLHPISASTALGERLSSLNPASRRGLPRM